ncbi:MAG: thioesterase family protein [Caldilineaceae bacterium]
MGLDATYRAQSGCSTYTAEGHILFLREMKLGAPIRITTQLLGYDAKRMHLFHTMLHAETNYVAATCEWMMIHVNVTLGKGAPMPEETLSKLAEIAAQHQKLPIPPQAGRQISLQSKKL